MADFYLSRCRISYTPSGGEELRLLTLDDVLAEPLTREWDTNIEMVSRVNSAWAFPRSSGNAALRISFTVCLAAPSMPALVRLLRRLEIALNTAPVGTALLEEGFSADGVPSLATRWTAAVTTATLTEATNEEAPPMVLERYGQECSAWGRAEIELTLTNPSEV